MSNLDYSETRKIGGVYNVRLVSQMESNKVSAVVSGTGSHKTFIYDVTKHFELPFQRDNSEIGSDGVLCLVYIRWL